VIRADINEEFPISVSLVDEVDGTLVTNQVVKYDVRTINDTSLSPPLTGVLSESSVEPGIYTTDLAISSPGEYIFYATCSGFLPNTEEILINEENVYELIKQNRHYNISVEDVPRTNTIPTASQAVRHVPLGKTDYIITTIKYDNMSDWSGSTVSGTTYAWYRTINEDVPYKMGGPF